MAERQGQRGFTNQQQLRQGRSPGARLSGDAARDDRAEAANEASVADVQPFLGYPFMHPMHDASADQPLAPGALRHQAEAQGDPRVYPGAPGRVRNALGDDEVPPGQAH